MNDSYNGSNRSIENRNTERDHGMKNNLDYNDRRDPYHDGKEGRIFGKLRKIVLMLLCSGIFMTGCSFLQKHENIDAGMAAIQNQDYNGALSSFETALSSGEDQQLISRGEGIAYMGLTRYDEAIDAFLNGISYNKVGPDNITYDMNYYLATCYYKTGQLKKAINVYDSIVALKPRDAMAYYLRGSVKLDNDEHDEAVTDFETAIELSKKDYDMYICIYQSLDKNGYGEEGQTYLRNLLDQGGTDMSNYDKGRISFYLEDYDSARNYLEEARTETSSNADVILTLGKTYEMLGDYNYAASVYNDYLQDDTTQAEVYNQLGLCKLHIQDYQSALETFQAGLQIENNPMMQTMYYNEIVAYEYLQDYKQAAVEMKKYLALYPDDENAKREYEFLQTR
ncbi:MAG: tetratricopeptide repeat protein [Lachnospiraceae bacterium]|nr:tetratricopeptide repeat protein [Lachnospiraceae bacterium]